MAAARPGLRLVQHHPLARQDRAGPVRVPSYHRARRAGPPACPCPRPPAPPGEARCPLDDKAFEERVRGPVAGFSSGMPGRPHSAIHCKPSSPASAAASGSSKSRSARRLVQARPAAVTLRVMSATAVATAQSCPADPATRLSAKAARPAGTPGPPGPNHCPDRRDRNMSSPARRDGLTRHDRACPHVA
jgi:hypothetical protein